MRCFAAIELPGKFVALSEALRQAVSLADASWGTEKWVVPENLHVTLAFFAHLDDKGVEDLVQACRTASLAPFSLDEPVFEARPRPHSVNMAWLRLTDATGRGGELAGHIERCMRAHRDPSTHTHQKFTPHVTLVRARRPHEMNARAIDAAKHLLGESRGLSVSVSTVTVFSSTLTPSGPRYHRVETVGIREL